MNGNAIERAVQRMITAPPDGPGTPARPPIGAAIAIDRPGGSRVAVAGLRAPPSPAAPDGLPLTAETHHDLASVTKAVTTTAVLRLVSEHLLRLEQPVRHLIPGFHGGSKDTVTVRDLLLHRGGLWEWWPLYLAATDREQALRHCVTLPLRHPPGAGRHYSDLGFILLGRIVERAAGQELRAAIEALVTTPLGMASTRFARPAGARVAASAHGDHVERAMLDSGRPYPVPYRSADFAGWRHTMVSGEVNDGNAFHALGGVCGHAGLFGTLDDLIRLGMALADYANHDTLWRPEVAEEFFTPGPDPGQALGFRRYPFSLGGEPATMLGHPGFVGCAFGFVPGRGIAVGLATLRLLAAGPPAPTEALWARARAVAGTTINATPDDREG